MAGGLCRMGLYVWSFTDWALFYARGMIFMVSPRRINKKLIYPLLVSPVGADLRWLFYKFGCVCVPKHRYLRYHLFRSTRYIVGGYISCLTILFSGSSSTRTRICDSREGAAAVLFTTRWLRVRIKVCKTSQQPHKHNETNGRKRKM